MALSTAARRVGRATAYLKLVRQANPTAVGRAYRTRKRWERPMEAWARSELRAVREELSVAEVVAAGRAAWGPRILTSVRKQSPDSVVPEIVNRLQFDTSALERGALASYLGLATDLTAEAGQLSLDILGINKTWRWVSPRDTVPDLFQARGSKIIQGMYGTHLDQLARIAADATNPASPKTIDQVTREIRSKWSNLTDYQARRIARTETAVMWETTASNTYALNGILRKEWLAVAPLDEACSGNASAGIIPFEEEFPSGDSEPPAHPHCVCDLLPVLRNEDGSYWLPPQEPFTGNTMIPSSEPTVPLDPSDISVSGTTPAATEAQLRSVQASAKEYFTDIKKNLKVESRWNGDIAVGKRANPLVQNGTAGGTKDWACTISLSDRAVSQFATSADAKRVLVHEMSHSFSVGSTNELFIKWRAWEEGTVECYSRAFMGQSLLDDGAYQQWVSQLERYRRRIAKSGIAIAENPLEFYGEMLRVPLAERAAWLEKLHGGSVVLT